MIRKIVKATGFELTPAIDSSVDKVVVAIDKYVDPSDTGAMVEIELAKTTNHHRSGDIFRAEINFHSRIGSLRSESEKDDLYVALSEAKDEIVESLRTKKSKRIDFVRKSGAKLKNMLRGFYGRNFYGGKE